MIKIPVPSKTNTEIKVPLSGKTYSLYFTYSRVSERHYLSIYRGSELLVAGVKLIDGSMLLGKYTIEQINGDMFVAKLIDTTEPPTRNNIGIGKNYELIFVSSDELRELT